MCTHAAHTHTDTDTDTHTHTHTHTRTHTHTHTHTHAHTHTHTHTRTHTLKIFLKSAFDSKTSVGVSIKLMMAGLNLLVMNKSCSLYDVDEESTN